MQARANESGDLVVISGELECSSATDIRSVLHDAVDRGAGDLIVDLGAVDHVDVTGIGVLVGAHRRAQRAGRRVVLRAVPPRISRWLVVTRLNRVIATEAALVTHG